MCSDFFYPLLGGVETHIFQLSLSLVNLGHKVIIVTHGYGDRQGVRYITNGIKVYYVPFKPVIGNAIFFQMIPLLPLFRKILIRERIDIVHCHSTSSIFAEECLLHARTMGYKAVFTDHSLFGFSDMACLHVNKLCKFFLSDIDHMISVSHVSKESISLRAQFDPQNISVIPNAVDCHRFKPNPSKRYPLNTINIVFIARLTFRKGVDLLIDIMPQICSKFPQVHFIIGGDGPKKSVIERIVKENNLQDRVEILGRIEHRDVRETLIRGHIFLNTSLTEAFCIAICEAASSGLLVVSTDVGGVREVLPDSMIYLAQPTSEDVIEKLTQAIPQAKNVRSQEFHDQMKKMYNWTDVARRTEKVYDKIMRDHFPSIKERMKRYYSSGPAQGIIMLAIVMFDLIFFLILNFFFPEDQIERAIDFPNQQYVQNREKYGDHTFTVLKQEQETTNKN